MATVRLTGVKKVISRGNVYYYAWVGGPRLNGLPGSKEFASSYADALEARQVPDKSRVGGLITNYKASPAWLDDLAPTTRKTWSRWLDEIRTEFGPFKLAMFRRPGVVEDIEAWRDKFRESPRNADMAVQVLSRLLSYGRVAPNPCRGITKLYKSNRSDVIWTEQELQELSKHASPELMMAARLAALTGLRQDDCRNLKWSEIGELAIERPAAKSRSGRGYLIPLYSELKKQLAVIPRRSVQVLTNTRGRPWKSGLSDSFGDAARRAGIDKHFHDLRGTAATRLYLAGFSLREIAEILAWEEESVGQIINRYVRRDAMLRDRIRRLDRTRTKQKVENI